ncbi:hypothetical protein ACSHWB_45490 [Lentzea sp. HUAS TT2]
MITNVPARTCPLGLDTSASGAPTHQHPISGSFRRARTADFGPAP